MTKSKDKAKTAKAQITKRFNFADGSTGSQLPESPENVLGRVYTFPDGDVIRAALEDFPAPIQRGFGAFGMAAVLNASMNGAGEDVAAAKADLKSRLDALLAGKWTSRVAGDGVRRESIIFEAIVAAAEDAGRVIDLDKLRNSLLAKDIEAKEGEVNAVVRGVRAERREAWRKRRDVEEHYLRIRAERAAEQAEKGVAEGDEDGETEGPGFEDFDVE